MNRYEKARRFIYRNARPLDMARWQYHFENGARQAVLHALSFGKSILPYSTHPIVQGILRYLASGKDFDGHFWHSTVNSNNDYPHAPWWHTGSDNSCHSSYNPTACLAGFIIRYAKKESAPYALGCRIAREAFGAYGEVPLCDMHTALCYVRLAEYCGEAGADHLFDLDALRSKLMRQVKSSITQNTAEWESSYICRPSQFFRSRDSIFYDDNRVIAEYECDFIINSQLDDGSWSIPWAWSDYPEQWAIAKNWWKANGIIVNILYLRGFGRI